MYSNMINKFCNTFIWKCFTIPVEIMLMRITKTACSLIYNWTVVALFVTTISIRFHCKYKQNITARTIHLFCCCFFFHSRSLFLSEKNIIYTVHNNNAKSPVSHWSCSHFCLLTHTRMPIKYLPCPFLFSVMYLNFCSGSQNEYDLFACALCIYCSSNHCWHLLL